MKVTMTMKTIIFLCLILIASVIVFFTYKQIEPFDNHCPTTLIKEGDHFLLYNPSLAKVPGVNPIKLNSLEDYEEYIKWQKSNEVNCPVLKLESGFNNYKIDSYSGSSGVLNHNMVVTDSNMKTESCLGNINLGQNLYSNYEYNYYNSNLNDSYNLSMLPNGPNGITPNSSMSPGSHGNTGTGTMETGLPLISGPNSFEKGLTSGPNGYTGTGIGTTSSDVGTTKGYTGFGPTGMGSSGLSGPTGLSGASGISGTTGPTGSTASNVLTNLVKRQTQTQATSQVTILQQQTQAQKDKLEKEKKALEAQAKAQKLAKAQLEAQAKLKAERQKLQKQAQTQAQTQAQIQAQIQAQTPKPQGLPPVPR